MPTAAEIIEIIEKATPIIERLQAMGLRFKGTISVVDVLALFKR
jgi:hypothetical protein